MERHKLTKSIAVTTLAIGSVAVVAPTPIQAATFTDLNDTNTHYANIMELYERGVISGYNQPDGTKQFKPNAPLTRAHAAKMLANALGLDTNIETLRDPGFTDVPKSHAYYPYIAALANEGIVSGYSDGTYRPGAQTLRQHMAKVLTIGYGLDKATKLTHHFTDVSNNTEAAYYIQTLWNYQITKGTSPTTFGPTRNLTRGQMATFIVNTEKVAKDRTVEYTITDVTNQTVTINDATYTFDRTYNQLFKTANAAALKGAVIEGQIANGKIQHITKLTLKANGTSRSYVVFDGGGTTFNGDIDVQSNYVTLRNLNVNGTLTIPTTDVRRQSLSIVENQLVRMQTASTFNQYGLTAATSTLPSVSRYVVFEEISANRVVVTQNKLQLKTNKELRELRVEGEVEQLELLGDVRDVFVETDVSTVLYGKANVRKLTKDNYGNVSLFFDGIINRYIVNNREGGTNLATMRDSNGNEAEGVDLWIDTAVLMQEENPNLVFNDYKNDAGNITIIVDKDGNEIDKSVDENVQVPDRIAPILTGLKVAPTSSNSANVSFNTNEAGTYYYVVLESSQAAPTKRQVLAQAAGEFQGTGGMMEGENSFTLTNLHSAKEYKIYMVIEDNAGNTSSRVESVTFNMANAPDTLPPRLSNVQVEPHRSGQKATLNFTSSEAGMFYIVVTPGRNSKGYDAQTIINIALNDTSKYKTMVAGENTIEIAGLDPLTDYSVALVGVDPAENRSIVEEKGFTTLPLDDIKPYVTNYDIEFINPTQFYLYFSEELNKEAAENVQNYDLTGTGIINISGQMKIKPIKVEYSRAASGQSRVLLTLPALTGLVQNDTIVATALPGVTDLADNPVVTDRDEDNPRNYATYRHTDVIRPSLVITKFEKLASETHAQVTLETSEAGTFYYVVLPAGIDKTTISMRDVMDRVDFTVRDDGNVAWQPVYPGDNPPLDLGEQVLDVAIPTNLSQFISWSMYAFMVDRSGNLSNEIIELPMVMDKMPPVITSISGTATEDSNTSGNLNFTADEPGIIEYIAIPKELQANLGDSGYANTPEQFERLKNTTGVRTGTADMRRGQNIVAITPLQAHKDYTIYFMARDTSQNQSVQVYETSFYTDGKRPEVQSNIVRQPDGSFEITFSEAIKRDAFEQPLGITQSDLTVTVAGNETGNYRIEEYKQGSSTTAPSKLRIRFDQGININQTITVTMNDSAFDSVKVNQLFAENAKTAQYEYQAINVAARSANLQGNLDPAIPYHTYHSIVAVFSSSSTMYDMEYRYAVVPYLQNPTANVTAAQVATGEGGNRAFSFTGNGFLANTNTSIQIALTPDLIARQAVFAEEDYVYFVILDRYGNMSEVSQVQMQRFGR
ncbi:S-layer homology domain-containing protein [Caryophanon tenue]|uniref:SLH domain-containing protein n=1 Tax=Caryophanon tenue TaxID=33978 RepID=A0A1C0YB20_9BACL|nr:S-layer homology domain-containing protein [Caryophanon tenue]OCS84323.1 hypothetical protein A6M13_15680 [Caryophanon tenue]